MEDEWKVVLSELLNERLQEPTLLAKPFLSKASDLFRVCYSVA